MHDEIMRLVTAQGFQSWQDKGPAQGKPVSHSGPYLLEYPPYSCCAVAGCF